MLSAPAGAVAIGATFVRVVRPNQPDASTRAKAARALDHIDKRIESFHFAALQPGGRKPMAKGAIRGAVRWTPESLRGL
jgi:hypothetical protein